jgi:hypothetical protein
MKRVIVIIVVLTILYSCKKGDCYFGIANMKLYSIVNTKTSKPSDIQDWYHFEFQNGLLNFSMEFSHYVTNTAGGTGYCNEDWDNYPDEKSIIITCNKNIFTTNAETIIAGQSLNDCFSITKFESEKDYYIYGFLISEKQEYIYKFSEQYYTFFATLETDKNEFFKDSCIVKRF